MKRLGGRLERPLLVVIGRADVGEDVLGDDVGGEACLFVEGTAVGGFGGLPLRGGCSTSTWLESSSTVAGLIDPQ